MSRQGRLSAFDEIVLPLLLEDDERRARAREGHARHMETLRASRAERERVDADEHDWHLRALLAEATVIRREPAGHDAIGGRIDAAIVRGTYPPDTHDAFYAKLPKCTCLPWPGEIPEKCGIHPWHVLSAEAVDAK